MAARFGCQRPNELSPEQRAACADRLGATTQVTVKAEPYFRMREHAAIMAKVRRAENGGYRASCEAMRNLDATCPNLLPDNLAEDFELPRD